MHKLEKETKMTREEERRAERRKKDRNQSLELTPSLQCFPSDQNAARRTRGYSFAIAVKIHEVHYSAHTIQYADHNKDFCKLFR